MKISIITVCRNSGKTIERAIRSVISQQYSDLEYIVIDGGSVDDTCQIIRKYEKNISYWLSEPDEGIYDAMNKGISVATGEVIAFLNSDDWYEKNTFNCIEKSFRENDVDMVSGGICLMKDGRASITASEKPENMDDYFFNIGFPHPSLFAKAYLFQSYGMFDVTYKIAADYDWMLRVCLAGAKVLTVKDCLTYFAYGGVSTVRKYDALKEQYQSSLHYMEYYGKEYLREKINKYYEKELNTAKRGAAYTRAIQYHSDRIKGLLDGNKRYYIWGTGNRGMECMELFEKVGLGIAGFIDSYKTETEIKGYRVIRPEKIDSKNPVCITPKGYEEEIIYNLKSMGLGDIEYFTYAELLNQIISLGIVET